MTARKFKIGDRVRILHTDYPEHHALDDIGEVFSVMDRVDEDGEGPQGLDIVAPGHQDSFYYYSGEVEFVGETAERPRQDAVTIPKDLWDGSSIRLPAGTLHFEGAKLRFVPDGAAPYDDAFAG